MDINNGTDEEKIKTNKDKITQQNHMNHNSQANQNLT